MKPSKVQRPCIVIPIYQNFTALTELPKLSLKQAASILNKYPIFLVSPKGLDISDYLDFFTAFDSNIEVIQFNHHFFNSVQDYNHLLLSSFFYETFADYPYILIYQTDAWIFKDELEEWCAKGYDYIGAPFVNWEWSTFYARHLTFPRRLLYRLGYRNFNLVGNGGLSLRNTKACIHNLKWFKKAAANFTLNEDYFFSFYINSYNPLFRVAPFKEALKFSFDENPEASLKLNHGQLPMGCHAWPKYASFWKDYIPFDYRI